MSAEVWSIIATGIVILIAIATSNRALRKEMNECIDGLARRIDGLDKRINELSQRINAVENRLLAHLGDLRERIGRVEGMLQGFWAAARQRHERSGDVQQRDTTGLP